MLLFWKLNNASHLLCIRASFQVKIISVLLLEERCYILVLALLCLLAPLREAREVVVEGGDESEGIEQRNNV